MSSQRPGRRGSCVVSPAVGFVLNVDRAEGASCAVHISPEPGERCELRWLDDPSRGLRPGVCDDPEQSGRSPHLCLDVPQAMIPSLCGLSVPSSLRHLVNPQTEPTCGGGRFWSSDRVTDRRASRTTICCRFFTVWGRVCIRNSPPHGLRGVKIVFCACGASMKSTDV